MATKKPTSNAQQPAVQHVQIKAANMKTASFLIIGTAPLVMCKFSQKAKNIMMETQAAGSTAKTKKTREAKNFDEIARNAVHYSRDGWPGIPASAFRAASISACRLVGFKMTLAKLSIFIVPDGFSNDDGTPLVKLITTESYRRVDHAVRNATGVVDIRSRPMFDEWKAELRVRFDADQFTETDIANLIARVGEQVGILEGRPDSKNSAGMGWGTFRIADEDEVVGLAKPKKAVARK